MIVTCRFDQQRNQLLWRWSLMVVLACTSLLLADHSVLAQRIVDNGPRFAADTASAWSGRNASGNMGGASMGGGWVGGGWVGGGWNGWTMPYSVRLAGQNPNFPLAVYGSPRQYGAHDHGFQHVRHPDQARFNQFGRHHWVATPLFPCWQPCPPVCVPWSPWCSVPPICSPWLAPPGWGWSHPWGWNGGWNNGWCGWNGGWNNGWGGWNAGWGWQGWRRQAWGWNGLGMVGGMAQQHVQILARPGAGVMAPLEVSLAPTAVANALLESRAADVLAQQRAVAAAEQAAAQQRSARSQPPSAVALDPLGRPRGESPVVETVGERNVVVSSRVETPVKPAVDTKPRGSRVAAGSLEQRRAAEAEAERQRLLQRLRGEDPKTGGQ